MLLPVVPGSGSDAVLIRRVDLEGKGSFRPAGDLAAAPLAHDRVSSAESDLEART
jgi:hypothetical protein